MVNGTVVDILFDDVSILEVGSNIEDDNAMSMMFPDNVYLSPGWIDIHTHCYDGFQLYQGTPDDVGYKLGVTTVVDAGTTGGNNVDQFYQKTKNAITNVFAFLNISKIGIEIQSELSDINNIDFDLISQKVETYPDFLVGLKARMSKTVVGEQGIKPLVLGKEIAHKHDLPMMIHIGSNPPELEDVLNMLSNGDIVTHIYNGKPNGILRNGKIMNAAREAKQRGIVFDIGHGSESFSFQVAQHALEQGFMMDSISTDIYSRNMKDGPVYDMATVLNKFLALGLSLNEVIDAVTIKPAKLLNMGSIGEIKVGYRPDFTLFKMDQPKYQLIDSLRETRKLKTGIVPTGVFVKGVYYEI